jgi:hypothetical protein
VRKEPNDLWSAARRWDPILPPSEETRREDRRAGWWLAAIILVGALGLGYCANHGGIVGGTDPCAHVRDANACSQDQGSNVP